MQQYARVSLACMSPCVVPAGVVVGSGVLVVVAIVAVGMVTANGLSIECALMSPIELMAATEAVYSAFGTRPCSVTLVSVVNNVVVAPVPSRSWYVTL